MFRQYELWYHASTLDIALDILKVQYRGTAYIKVRAKLVNRHNHTYYETRTFKILRKDLPHWKRIERPLR